MSATRCFIVCAFVTVGACSAADWPQWRGPTRDGQWPGGPHPVPGPDHVVTPTWRVPIGAGYAGPVVADGRVLVMDRLTEPTAMERVVCVSADTGEPRWMHRYACECRRVGYPAGPRAAATVHGDRVYTLGTMGHVFCLDAVTGQVVWSRDARNDFDARVPRWGPQYLTQRTLLMV